MRTLFKTLLAALLLAGLLTTFTACREKTTGEKIEDAIEDVGDKIGDAVDEVGDAVDDAKEKVDEAAEKVKEEVEDDGGGS